MSASSTPLLRQKELALPVTSPAPKLRFYLSIVYIRTAFLGLLSLSVLWHWPWTSRHHLPKPTAPDLRIPKDLRRALSIYTPYYPVERYRIPPHNCKVTQVNIIQRHGARNPTSGVGSKIRAAVAKLKSVRPYHSSKEFNFLKEYVYDLGEHDLLPYGAAESYDAGALTYARYQHLASPNNPPFIRASDTPRVVDSATNWTLGYTEASKGHVSPTYPLLISEEPGANNTLDNNQCPSTSTSSAEQTAWLVNFAPLASRLNEAAPGANLTNEDAVQLMSLCSFDTLSSLYLSPWCSFFSKKDLAAYEYWGDLGKYYGNGYGEPLGAVQGVGYINELLARLTSSPVVDATQTNRTLDASPLTFPLDRPIYVDFSHDNEMVSVFTAMGLFAGPLSPTKPDRNRKWRVTKMVPFGARMVVEKLECGTEKEEKVRVLVNDAVQPLEFCEGVTKDGVCSLEAFVKSQAYSVEQGRGDWPKCFADS